MAFTLRLSSELYVQWQQSYEKLFAPTKVSAHALASAEIDLMTLSQYFREIEKQSEKKQLMLEHMQVCTALLSELTQTLGPHVAFIKEKKKLSSMDKAKLVLLVSAGVLFAAFEGFDNVVTLVSIFPLTMPILLATGVVFSCSAIFIFCSKDFLRLKRGLNDEQQGLLDEANCQFKLIKNIRKNFDKTLQATYRKIAESQKEEKTVHYLEQELKSGQDSVLLLAMLDRHLQVLMAMNSEHTALADNPHCLLKVGLTAIISLLVFSSGFCAGQMVGQFCLSFFYASIAANALPVVVIGGLLGLVAFSASRFPDLKKMIASWRGVDVEYLQKMNEKIAKEENKISCLKEKYEGFGRFFSSTSASAQQAEYDFVLSTG